MTSSTTSRKAGLLLAAGCLIGWLLASGCSTAGPVEETPGPGLEGGLYFPPDGAEWERVDAAAAGWDPKALEAVLEYAGEQRSSALVILLHGRILAERSWNVETSPDVIEYSGLIAGHTPDGQIIEDVASIQKSVVSFLVGVAERQGLVDIEAPVSSYLGQGWTRATPEQEEQILVRHLLSMASGLNEDLTYKGQPGQLYQYNTPVYSRLVTVLEEATGREINLLTSEWLTGLIGMRDSRWWVRPGEVMVPWANVIGFVTTARDLARFGRLMLAEGNWAGEDLLRNPVYFKRMLSPSTEANPSYGWLWWLNGGTRWIMGRNNTEAKEGALIPAAPDDLYAALGSLGRKLFVVPSLDLVVTRLGDEPPDSEFSNEIWKRLLKAAPAQGHRSADYGS